jgi:anti-sigma B factor antagonist
MAFKLTTRTVEEVTVIDLSGRLDLAEGSAVFREALQNIPARDAKILINLTEVSFVDTSGLGELVSAHTRAQHEGACLKLTGIPRRMGNLLEMTGLHRILDIHDTEADAIQSWGDGPFVSDSVLSETAA